MNMKLLLVLLSGASCACALNLLSSEWTMFKALHNKSYENFQEEQKRMTIYLNNKKLIHEHNMKYERGEVSFRLQVNHFADKLPSEIKSSMNGYKPSLGGSKRYDAFDRQMELFANFWNQDVPDSVDWREKGAVTEIKNQGENCGGCWAFSATGCLEGQIFLKTGRLISLSEQNLFDCSRGYMTNGCEGGLYVTAWQYIIDNHGIEAEHTYSPYIANISTCEYDPSRGVASASGFVNLPRNDEELLKIAVANIGPISVGMDSSQVTFYFYSGGVYYEQDCSPINLDHAVLIVGYGTENGLDYWLIKNSWGPAWGEKGFMKLARNRNNHCGIASDSGYVIV